MGEKQPGHYYSKLKKIYFLRNSQCSSATFFFSAWMLLPTKEPLKKQIFQVEAVLQERFNKKRKTKEYLVKYQYYPKKFNRWIPEKDFFSGPDTQK